MCNKIVVTEKPDCISWETIHEVLWSAHESTRKLGISYPTAEMSGDELREYLKKHNGHCLVAMDGEKVVGTMSYYVESVKSRFFKGTFLMIALVGNIPQYKGKGIFSNLYNRCYDYAKAQDLDGLTYGTAEKNHNMRKIFERKGFIPFRCHYNEDKGRYVVGGIFCFNKLPHAKWYYSFIFKLAQARTHLRHGARYLKQRSKA